MDPRFDEIFRELTELYRVVQAWPYYDVPRPPPRFYRAPELLSVITESIEAALVAIGDEYTLRADARLFLTANLHQLVLLPLTHRDSPRDFDAEMAEAIKQDAIQILRSAVEHAGRAEQRQLTAGHVLRGTSAVLDELNLKSWRIWD